MGRELLSRTCPRLGGGYPSVRGNPSHRICPPMAQCGLSAPGTDWTFAAPKSREMSDAPFSPPFLSPLLIAARGSPPLPSPRRSLRHMMTSKISAAPRVTTIDVASYGMLDTYPLDFQLINFSGHFRLQSRTNSDIGLRVVVYPKEYTGLQLCRFLLHEFHNILVCYPKIIFL